MTQSTPEMIAERREEIINACETLYQTRSFKEITLKDIGSATSFSRPTIYNYFETKEEIFLALFRREYDRWNEDLSRIWRENEHLSREQLADRIAASLEKRGQLLKLLAMNNYDMERSSRQELLTDFKQAYGESMRSMDRILKKFCPEMTESDRQEFIYIFFPYMFGIHPYTSVTDKQRRAMEDAGVGFVYQSAYQLICTCLRKLLR